VLTDEEDIANARLEFANGCVANVTASRVSNKTERKLRVFQPDAYISVDLHEKSLTIHRKSDNHQGSGIADIVVERRQYGASDPLYAELQSFLRSIREGTPPAVSGENGRQALEMALTISAQLHPQAPLIT
jgi:predicted dehydrogenase